MGTEPPGPPPSWPLPSPAEPSGAPPAGVAPPAARRSRGNLLAVVAVGVAVVVVVAALAAYGLAGHQAASNRIATASSAVDKTVSHESEFEQSMSDVSQGLGGFTSSNAKPTQYKASVDQFVKTAQQEQRSVDEDAASLDSASRRLHDSAWLTVFERNNLDRAAARVAHAQAALGIAKKMSADLVQDGAFYEAFADSLVDLDNVGNQSQAANITGALTAVGQLKTDVGKALSLANAPGMPDEMHQFLVDFQNLANDFESLFNAGVAGDMGGVSAAKAKGDADLAALKNLDVSSIGTKIAAFYQPMESAYQRDLQQASS